MNTSARRAPFVVLFVEHPEAVGQTYWVHLHASWRFSSRLLVAGLAGMVHGLVPGLFERTASTAVKGLHAELARRAAANDAL